MENEVKGLLVEIFKNPMFETCSNRGVSETNNSALLIGEGIPAIFPANGRPVLRMVKGNLPGTVKIVPVEQPKGMNGPMMGGAFVYTSDSRFTEAATKISGVYQCGAIPLHDRFEDWNR